MAVLSKIKQRIKFILQIINAWIIKHESVWIIIWVTSLVMTIWGFGCIICRIAGIDDMMLKITSGLGGVVFLVLLLYYLAKWNYDRNLPHRLTSLGVVIVALALIAQSYPGESICLLRTSNRVISQCQDSTIRFWLGDRAAIWGAFAFLVGLAQWYFDKREKWREQNIAWREQLRLIEEQTRQDPFQALQRVQIICSEMDKQAFAVEEVTKSQVIRLVTRYEKVWEHSIITQIDRMITRGEQLNLSKISEMISDIQWLKSGIGDECSFISVDSITGSQKSGSSINWEVIKYLYRQSQSRIPVLSRPSNQKEEEYDDEKIVETIWGLWNTYDILAREWIVELINLWFKFKNNNRSDDKDKDSSNNINGMAELLMKKFKQSQSYRRLLRHSKIKKRFPDLSSPPKYALDFPVPTGFWSQKEDNITDWLDKNPNPFGAARIEHEEIIHQKFFYPTKIVDLMKGEHMSWIYAPSGNGRTALAYYFFELVKKEKHWLPLYLTLNDLNHLSGTHFLEKILDTLIDTWGKILTPNTDPNPIHLNGAVAFLDLDYKEQLRVAHLMMWRFGKIDKIFSWLTKLDIDLERNRDGIALKDRLEQFADVPSSRSWPLSWLIYLAHARPAGWNATYVMVEWEKPIPTKAARSILYLAEKLQQNNTYLKILAPQRPPKICPQGELLWNYDTLAKLLDRRLQGSSLSIEPEAKKLLLNFVVRYGRSSPRTLIQIGNLALRIRTEREKKVSRIRTEREENVSRIRTEREENVSQDNLPSPEEEAEKRLTQEDICNAIRQLRPTYEC